ncbi:MAG: MBL fold metallo-hydrolase, partial [Desulfoferrobacter sp.]
SPVGKSLLIDAGNNGMGNKKVLPLLRTLKIVSLDYVVATHYDADHIGGLDEVVNGIGVKIKAYDRGELKKTKKSKTYKDYAASIANKHASISPGEEIDLGPVRVTCMAVNGKTVKDPPEGSAVTEENACSVALKLRYGGFDYFIGGDISGGGRSGTKVTDDVEGKVAPLVGDVDVLRISHHGSTTSSNESFLAATRPEVAVISVGNGGSNYRYHHPSRDVLDRFLALQGLRIVFQTNRGETLGGITDEDLKTIRITDGDVVLSTDGNTYMVNGMLFPVDEQTSTNNQPKANGG